MLLAGLVLLIEAGSAGGPPGPEQVVMQQIASRPGGCMAPRLIPSKFESEHQLAQEGLKRLEAEGQLKWEHGRPVLAGELKRDFDAAPPAEKEALLAVLKDHGATFHVRWQWFRDAEDRSRIDLLPPEDVSLINEAASTMTVEPAKQGQADAARLSPGVIIASGDDPRCRYQLRMSRTLRDQDWAFITTGAQWAPLAGEGRTWALHREDGMWRIRGFTRDWVS